MQIPPLSRVPMVRLQLLQTIRLIPHSSDNTVIKPDTFKATVSQQYTLPPQLRGRRPIGYLQARD